MLGLSKQVQQALAFLLLVLVFGGGILYGRWQQAPAQDNTFLLERNDPENLKETASGISDLKVHVAGAVKKPGVYTFKPKDRVEDVLALAEPLMEADLDNLNLAGYLKDEQRIFVPYRLIIEGADGPITAAQGGGNGKINLNTATKDELTKLPGIGPTLAQRVVDYREKNGFFSSVDELKQVSGIGDKKFAEIEDLVTN
ncbi:MAG: helix-hairpin-helix domain-containing protein [Bacillota bacterium]